MKGLRDGPRVDIGHAVSKTAAPSESHSHCKKKDGKPNLVILKVNSKRESSFRALVDCGASNNFVRLQRLARLDFEEVEVPRSLLEVRPATGVVVRTEKRVVCARFSSSGATESDGPVGSAHAPRGACDPPAEAARDAAASDLSARTLTTERVVREKCEPNQKPQIRSDLRGSRSVKGDAVVSTVVDTQVVQEWPVTEGSDLGASAQGADAIGPNIKGRSAVRRRGKRGASAAGTDATSSADGCKRAEPEMFACSRAAGLHDEAVHNQAGLDCVRPRDDPADEQTHACSRAAGLHDEAIHNQAGLDCVRPRGDPTGDQKKDLSTAGPGQNKMRGTGFRTRSERRKRAKLRKSRSGTETLQAVSAGQTQRLETTVGTRSVLTRTDTGLHVSPATCNDGRIEQICILSDIERMESEEEELKQLVTEGADALSAKSKKERFDEQSWDSLKSSPLYEVLREYKDVLPDDIPAGLPQNKGVQHEIDLVPGTKYCVTR
ncbi:unnamed protein product [Phytophthora fragariaefolia]|uniref:Unnamed protein product n=1 Tax=Phytophthora fragariaefolia TaxID=1490495 RepID=A0A9W7D673_9STRA|nr:unnamed protein product [Phytophthora fragariaefolia]